MDLPAPNPNPNPSPKRVLTRPPGPSLPELQPQPSVPPQPPQCHFPNGVVVVGFISRSPDHCSQLMNRVIDSNAFGSGNLDRVLFADNELMRDWLKWRRISYFHDKERGFLFLQFCSNWSSVGPGLSGLEDREYEDLQGLLFMFSVCHVIIYIQEGSRFDARVLRKFRVLQAAKNALNSYMKSKNMPPLPSSSRPHSSAPFVKTTTLNSVGKSGSIANRNASSVSVMSGFGSQASLSPGHCTPVILFVFVDDFLDGGSRSLSVEDLRDSTLPNQTSNVATLSRPNSASKGSGTSGSVVMLARPGGKSEGGFRKKLLATLEGQIRFLIKKCRVLSGSETSHSGSRSIGVSGSAPLFSLDASKVVVLLDRSMNQKGESLSFATALVGDLLNGKATLDSFLLGSHGQSVKKDDFLSIKDFINRQSDILRGRGGLVGNTNGGPTVGVGMVAVAAAAAAASTASGKAFAAPELPSLEVWLLSSQNILHGILSAKRGQVDESEVGRIKPRQRNAAVAQLENVFSKKVDSIDIAVSLLESGISLNRKFSTLWCERALPVAKDIYLKDLPECYPTSQHEVHLAKALHAFFSMVRGTAVDQFAEKLEDECCSIWKSGRQLCDAVSLTGKPCKHQRHDSTDVQSRTGAAVKPHSSEYFFLHACACGRTRQLRPDPFDFESANYFFAECDKLLPSVQLPEGSISGPVQSSSWSLIRVGGARYYEPSKGLLQSGFSTKHKFLSKWIIKLGKPIYLNGFGDITVQQGSVIQSGPISQAEVNARVDAGKPGVSWLHSGNFQNGVEILRKSTEKVDDKEINFGRVYPNTTMKKAFSEVVAGSPATRSGFPPLQQKKQPPSSNVGKQVKQNRSTNLIAEGARSSIDEKSERSQDSPIIQEASSRSIPNGDPLLRIGSNVVPMNINDGETNKTDSTLKRAVVYVGFEHECPYGHRFLLSADHLNQLGPLYTSPKESLVPPVETPHQNMTSHPNTGRNDGRGKLHRNSKGSTFATADKRRTIHKSKETGTSAHSYVNGGTPSHLSTKEPSQTSIDVSNPDTMRNLNEDLHSFNLDDDESAFFVLNRNLPVYMNCPYCRPSKNKDASKVKFAGNISQMQRIFLVTPRLPVVLATCPVIQFEASCLPPSVPDCEQKLQFSPGCQVVLPPESFVTLRLPFVYGVQLKDEDPRPLNAFESQPERTAWIVKGTALQLISWDSNFNQGLQSKP